MILWLTVAHTSLFNTPHQDFFLIKSGREAFFCLIHELLPANIFGKFLFDSPSFISPNFNVRNS